MISFIYFLFNFLVSSEPRVVGREGWAVGLCVAGQKGHVWADGQGSISA